MPTQFEWILFFRLLISVLLGVLIGFERTNRYKEAGIRTHAIVALGSCLLMILSKYGFMDTMDADHSRIAAQVVTGIGFLGAGMILVRKNTVSGLTTAAGIWTTSAVGMTIGAGMYFIGVSTAVLIILVQIVFHTKWFSRFDRSNDTFMVNCNTASIRDIIDYIKRYDEHSFPINIVCFNLYWIIKPPLVFLYESYGFIINATKFENLNFLLWLTTIVLFFGFILKVCFFMNEVIQEKTNYDLNLIHVILLPTSISIVIYLLYIAFLVVKWFFAWIFAV